MHDNLQLQRRDLEYGYPSLERGFGFGQASKCDSLQILQYGPKFRHSSEELDAISLRKWLDKDVNAPEVREGHGLVGGLRLLLGVCRLDPTSNNRCLPFMKDDFDLIGERLHLPEQFLPRMQARIQCAYKFSSQGTSALNESLQITCFVFRFGIYRPSYYHLAVSYCHSTKLSHALLLSKTVDHSFDVLTQRLKTLQQHIAHPLLLPVLLVDICLASSATRTQLADDRLNELEETMGQHEWINRPLGDPLKLDFVSTTRTLNFTARTLGVEKMRIQGTLLTLSNILQEVEHLQTLDPQEQKTYIWMKETIAYHTNTAQNLSLRAEYEEKRVQTQLAVVYQFMSQKDSKVNIQLAETSALIARESKKDSSAMKAIAVLTMFFLPGTFLATIFAMPLFNWDSNDGPRTKDGFKLYWAIAIPLTVGVLGIWILSMVFPWIEWLTLLVTRKRQRQRGSSSQLGEVKGDAA
ncbi:uncharacterized protein PAC_06050 [Phialocephala subalpina]|uniref:Uncharacterized protein n=1 Tax=Phialocephala subalpina TaxID=576137 RepID=A0A1L7WTS4_9HELO|nr:uncharacterized protein PAC_06050 [Phialocephala subalpina]